MSQNIPEAVKPQEHGAMGAQEEKARNSVPYASAPPFTQQEGGPSFSPEWLPCRPCRGPESSPLAARGPGLAQVATGCAFDRHTPTRPPPSG